MVIFVILEEHPENVELNKKVDIGFPFLQPSRSSELKQRLEVVKAQRKNEELEKLARSNKCEQTLELCNNSRLLFIFLF